MPRLILFLPGRGRKGNRQSTPAKDQRPPGDERCTLPRLSQQHGGVDMSASLVIPCGGRWLRMFCWSAASRMVRPVHQSGRSRWKLPSGLPSTGRGLHAGRMPRKLHGPRQQWSRPRTMRQPSKGRDRANNSSHLFLLLVTFTVSGKNSRVMHTRAHSSSSSKAGKLDIREPAAACRRRSLPCNRGKDSIAAEALRILSPCHHACFSF